MIQITNLPADIKEAELKSILENLKVDFSFIKLTVIEGNSASAIIWFRKYKSCKIDSNRSVFNVLFRWRGSCNT